MPCHKIHIKIVQDINKELKLDNNSIMLGSVLPDLTITKDHGLSHFQCEDEYPHNLANADEFIKKYPTMKDDISIGYIIHLLTDKYYNDWYYKNYKLKGINTTKDFKHNLFDQYDKYILRHFKLNKFDDTDVIKMIPKYKDLDFNYDYLKEYMDKFNEEIENSYIDLEYKIEKQEVLDILYNNCIKYIKKWLKDSKIH